VKIDILKEEISIEFESMEMIVNEINSLLSDLKDDEPTVREKAAISSFLMQFYNGVENILKRICKFQLISLPKGESWHIELFEKFCHKIEVTLPILISENIKNDLVSLRRFRHFVHHGYSFKIEWSRMESGVKSIDRIFMEFKNSVLNYIKILENK
jgi:hypothetical protein